MRSRLFSLVEFYAKLVLFSSTRWCLGNRTSLVPQIVRLCFVNFNSLELPQRNIDSSKLASSSKKNTMDTVCELGKCFIGLMTSFLIWGLLQEKIITQPYETILPDGQLVIEYFHDSQFLVFTNRTLAFIVAMTSLLIKHRMNPNTSSTSATNNQIFGNAPLFKYSFASFSNIMSAWFQYEALKYVNFPTQVLAKSCKIIPVMLMGKIISRARFELYEYSTAILISLGMLAFLLGSRSDHHLGSSVSSITGIMLLVMYLVFDSFTSNWQGDLFKTYKMSSIQMMCGVNLFSSLFTAISLSIQGGFLESFMFAFTVSKHRREFFAINLERDSNLRCILSLQHSKFVLDCIILSISSAVGQLFIFHTIENFGPVVFTIIMTLRQVYLSYLFDSERSLLNTLLSDPSM